MRYAEYDDLLPWLALYGLALPDAGMDLQQEAAEKLLELATHDVCRFLGARYDVNLLGSNDVETLKAGTCIQACFRIGQGGDVALALDDGVASVAGVSFSLRSPARFSPEAAERLSGHGLYARSGTVARDAPPA